MNLPSLFPGRSTATLAFAGVLLLAGCGRKPPPPAFPPRPVHIAPVEQRDVPRYVDTIGKCSALYSVSIVAQVSGQITETHFTQGQEVAANDPLFTIDPRPYKAVLDRAQADLASHQALLKSKDAQLERSRVLVPGNFISKQDFEVLAGDADSLKAQVMSDQAAVDTARINYEFCTVRAPVAGRIGVQFVDKGNVVAAGANKVLVALNTLDPIYVDFTIVERDLAEVRRLAGNTPLKVLVTPLGPPQPPREGELLVIDNTVQAGAGTVRLRALVPNKDRGLWPEQFVDAHLTLETLANALLVPADAVKSGQMGSYVFVVKPDMTLDLRPVRPGQPQGDKVVILTGLKPGEKVVVGGQIMLAPGAKVLDIAAIPKGPPPAPPPSGKEAKPKT